MTTRDELERIDSELRDSPVYRFKTWIDRLLPVVLLSIPVVLYLEFSATADHPLYPYKTHLNTAILAYFVLELTASFALYEERTQFFADRWVDILLTLPFFTVFKGATRLLRSLTGLKALKFGKSSSIAKSAKLTKVPQKLGKLYTKGKKKLTSKKKEKEKETENGPTGD